MADFFILIGFVGIIVGLVMFLVALIKRNPKKTAGLTLGVCFVLFVIGGALLPPTDQETTKDTDEEQKIEQQRDNDENKEIEEQERIEREKAEEERIEKERAEKEEFERLEQERIEKEKAEAAEAEKKRQEEAEKAKQQEQVVADTDTEKECNIKGSQSGIYHTPSSNHYERTKNVARWFCSEQEAIDAGYRAPKR